ncbi:Predicted PurR-regulated permease PerM [Cnuella takakiae]|uniref:Predicted PurR-regulated permease PerM n=1 Tax=Cnuella takakiae TaxID=1302690 RepID=A0A1M5HGC8_9BACT|nr:AI-2E family transporter [Cnuella takakiae]OLY92862.1 AI-2E family transporter [Cnuella takakiae]SHG15005.1 Predicted PurR-regulated permease PerM [Cnuella takakiae]
MQAPDLKAFDQKVWRTIGMVALTLILLWIIKDTIRVFLLIITAILVSIFFLRLAGIIRSKTGCKQGLSLALAIIASIASLVLVFWFIGARVQLQIAELSDTLPASIENVRQKIEANPLGKRLLGGMGKSGQSLQKYAPAAQRFFTGSFGVLGDLYAILFLGIFFTISPKTYVGGLVRLVPLKGRDTARHVLHEMDTTLGHWLKGQLIAMLVVAVLTWVGLAIIGVPMAIALAIIAGLFNFVPNLGPLVAMIPAVLVGMMQGGNTALYVAGLYLLVQALESNLITPYIQNKMIEIPPALILMGQLLMGTLLGVMGIILATPLVALIMVAVRELYVKKQEAGSPQNTGL